MASKVPWTIIAFLPFSNFIKVWVTNWGEKSHSSHTLAIISPPKKGNGKNMRLSCFVGMPHSVVFMKNDPKEYSLDEILDSPSVYDPLTKLQCCPTSDGSAAAILVTEDFLVKNPHLKQTVFS